MTASFPRIRWGQDPQHVFATLELYAHDPNRSAPAPKSVKAAEEDDNRREDCDASTTTAVVATTALTESGVELVFGCSTISIKTSLYLVEMSLFDEVDSKECTWRFLPPCTVKVSLKKKLKEGSTKPSAWRHLLNPNAPRSQRANVQIDWEKWQVDIGSEDEDEEPCVGEEIEGDAPAPYSSAAKSSGGTLRNTTECSGVAPGEIPVPLSEKDRIPIPSDACPSLISASPALGGAAQPHQDGSSGDGLDEGCLEAASTFFIDSPHMTPAKRMLTLVRIWNKSNEETRNHFLDKFTSEDFIAALVGNGKEGEAAEKEREELRGLMRGVKGCLGQMSLDASAYEAEGVQAIDTWADDLQKLPTPQQQAQVVCHLISRLSREEQMIVLATLR